jgi:hypothetical protein
MGKRSVDREWQCARTWLYHEISKGATRSEGIARDDPEPSE